MKGNKSKIKLFAVAGILSAVAIVANVSPVFVSKAEKDEILQTIAGYKSWAKMTKSPLALKITTPIKPLSGQFQIDGASGSE